MKDTQGDYLIHSFKMKETTLDHSYFLNLKPLSCHFFFTSHHTFRNHQEMRLGGEEKEDDMFSYYSLKLGKLNEMKNGE